MYTELPSKNKQLIYDILAQEDELTKQYMIQRLTIMSDLTPFMSMLSPPDESNNSAKALTVAKYYSNKPKDDWPEEIIKGVILAKMDV